VQITPIMISINRWQSDKMAKWQKKSSSRSGQAMLELAIFGVVAIAALGFLIRIGMQANYEQETRMAAFRRSLAAAVADDAAGPDGIIGTADDIIAQDARATTAHVISHRQMPTPSDGYAAMPRMRSEASAFVVWGDRLTFSYMVDADEDGYPDLVDITGDLKPDPVDEGQKTRQQIIVRVDESEVSFRQDHFYGLNEITTGKIPCTSSAQCAGTPCDTVTGFCEAGAVVQRIPSRILVLESTVLNFTGLGDAEIKQTHGLGSTTPIITELTARTSTITTTFVNAPRTDAALLNGPDGIPGTSDDLFVRKSEGNPKTTLDDLFGVVITSSPPTPMINEIW